MADINFEVEGLAELEQALVDLGGDLGLKTLRAAGRSAMQPVLDDAIANVNVDSGDTRDALVISTRRGRGHTAVDIRVGPTRRKMPKTKGGRQLTGVGQKTIAQEYGTKKQQAAPFLRPALDNNARRVLDIFSSDLKAKIDRAARLAAARAVK